MSDYISREAAIEAMYKDAEAHPDHTFWTTQHEALRDIPAADVRPVVLCRECKYSHPLMNNCKKCSYWSAHGLVVADHDFCSHGERREES